MIFKNIYDILIEHKSKKVNTGMFEHKIELANRGLEPTYNELQELRKFALLHEYDHPRYTIFLKKYGYK